MQEVTLAVTKRALGVFMRSLLFDEETFTIIKIAFNLLFLVNPPPNPTQGGWVGMGEIALWTKFGSPKKSGLSVSWTESRTWGREEKQRGRGWGGRGLRGG